MTKKQKRTMAAVGIISGAVILAGAALANYSTSNGYEVGKAAAIGLLENENYSAEFTFEAAVDGEVLERANTTEQYDRNGDVVLVRTIESIDNDGWYSTNKEWCQDGMSIHQSSGRTYGTTTYVDNAVSSFPAMSSFDVYGYTDDDEKERINKYIRFGELLGDTLVGDLKNNVVYVAGDDNSSTYEISLNSVQVPEFVNAGLSALISTDEIEVGGLKLAGDPYVSDFTLRFTVDDRGRLTDGLMTGELKANDDNGEQHTLNAEITLKIHDYGTTQPQRVDIDSLENVIYTGSDGSVHTYTD